MWGRLALRLCASAVVLCPVDGLAHDSWVDGECVPAAPEPRSCASELDCSCGESCFGACHPPELLCCHEALYGGGRCPPLRHGTRMTTQFATPDPCLCLGRSNHDARACSALQLEDWYGDDFDDDGVPNEEDNCQCIPNPRQEDLDCDGIGRACEDPCESPKGGRPDPDTLAPDCVERDVSPMDEDGDMLGETSVLASQNGTQCGGCDPCPGDPSNDCDGDSDVDTDTDVDSDSDIDADADSDSDGNTGGPRVDIRGSGGCGCGLPGVPGGPSWILLVFVLALGPRSGRRRASP